MRYFFSYKQALELIVFYFLPVLVLDKILMPLTDNYVQQSLQFSQSASSHPSLGRLNVFEIIMITGHQSETCELLVSFLSHLPSVKDRLIHKGKQQSWKKNLTSCEGMALF